jgi:hypothetical protein
MSFQKTMYLAKASINKLFLTFEIKDKAEGKKKPTKLCSISKSQFNISNYFGLEPINCEVEFKQIKKTDRIKKLQFTVHINGDNESE